MEGPQTLLSAPSSWHWHSGSKSLPETLQEQWDLGALCWHILGNMLEHLGGAPHPPGHTLRNCEVAGVGAAWAQLGASWQVLECSWDPHHECWGPYGVSTGEILGHREDTKGPLETLKRLLGNSGVSLRAKAQPQASPGNLGLQGHSALWGHQGLLITASTRHSLLAALLLMGSLGWGWGRESTREPNSGPHCPGGGSKQLDLGQRSPTCSSAVWQQPQEPCSLVQKTSPEGGAAPLDCWDPACCQGPGVGPLQPPQVREYPGLWEAGLLAARTLSGLKP